jgi:hypothetical protein
MLIIVSILLVRSEITLINLYFALRAQEPLILLDQGYGRLGTPEI